MNAIKSPFLEVDFGSLKVKFYPLSVLQFQQLEDELQELMTPTPRGEFPFKKERYEKIMRVYHASAQRGDPTITMDNLKSIVDFYNMRKVNSAVMGQLSGDEELTTTEGTDQQTPTSPPTGGSSTPM